MGLLTTITLEVLPSRAYAPFPALLPFFKFVLEVMFCEGVQHRLRFCLDHLSWAKVEAFLSSTGETKKSRVDEGRQSCCFFYQTFLGEKESVGLYVVAM
jgi:hypothetical protein